MTAFATILALIPLAAGFNQGSIIAAELGTVVIGGLFSSTFLTLLVVPVVYSLVDGGKQTINRWFGRSPAEESLPVLAPAVAMAVPSGVPTRVAPPIGHAIPDMPIVLELPAAAQLPAGDKPSLIGRFLRWVLRR
jgi:HAE1 family hydrophobic/amphiphilic exporter-1